MRNTRKLPTFFSYLETGFLRAVDFFFLTSFWKEDEPEKENGEEDALPFDKRETERWGHDRAIHALESATPGSCGTGGVTPSTLQSQARARSTRR